MERLLIFKTAPNVDYFYDIDSEGAGEILFLAKSVFEEVKPHVSTKQNNMGEWESRDFSEISGMYMVERTQYQKSTLGRSLLGYLTMGPIGYLLGGLGGYKYGNDIFFEVRFKDGHRLIAFGRDDDFDLAYSWFKQFR